MDKRARFWDRIANKYAKQPVADEEAYQKKLKKTQEYFKPDFELLEIGCGTGTTALIHAPFVKHVQAVDISSKMIGIARSKAEKQNIKNVTFECSAIDAIKFSEHKYDMVLALSILHLLEDKETILDCVLKTLKPGGYLVSSTVCIGDNLKIFKFIAPIGKFFGLMPLVRIFTDQELQDSIKSAGFEIDHHWRPAKSPAVFIIAKKP